MTKLAGDNVQVLVNEYNLTGDSNRVVINDRRDMYDVSSFASSVHKFIPGKRNVALEHSGYMNAASASSSHIALNGSNVDGILSVFLGQNADPAEGDPAYSFSVVQGRYGINPAVGNFVPFSANFATKGMIGGWGVALAVPTTISSSSNGSAIDNGVATTNNGVAYLHVLTSAPSAGYTIAIEGADNAGFSTGVTTLGTFISDGSDLAAKSERLPISGNISRYVRWKATAGTGSIQIAISLVRF